jgi:hypothetical protein
MGVVAVQTGHLNLTVGRLIFHGLLCCSGIYKKLNKSAAELRNDILGAEKEKTSI